MTIRRMHVDEIIPEPALVEQLIDEQFPQWSGLPISPVASSGTDNAMFRLGSDKVIRMPRRPGMDDVVSHENRWLPLLGSQLPVSMPQPLGRGGPAHGYPYPWLVLTWLDGVNPVVGEIADPHRLARELAGFVTSMQSIDPTGAPATGRTLAERDNQVRSDIAALHGEIDVTAVTAVWELALTLPDAATSTWVHSDIAPGNILLVDDRLHAVIDFSGCGVGDPAIDLQVAWNLLPASARPTFRNELGVDDDTWSRARARALAQALVQLPYYRETNIPLATNARHVIREVLLEAA